MCITAQNIKKMEKYTTDFLSLHHCDCMELMKQYPDKYFDLAIVDPPYGIDIANMNMGAGKGKRCSKLQNRKWKPKDWDNGIPDEEYFEQLFRVSKNQIIWGGNYFIDYLPPSQYFAIWDKGEGLYGRSFAECEYAWVRSGGTRIRKINPVQKERIHPTQKPVELYDWLIDAYCAKANLILDTHFGSGSIALAVHKANQLDKMNLHLTACEIDLDYVNASIKRISNYLQQTTLNF